MVLGSGKNLSRIQGSKRLRIRNTDTYTFIFTGFFDFACVS
jgi:hypothetical protein